MDEVKANDLYSGSVTLLCRWVAAGPMETAVGVYNYSTYQPEVQAVQCWPVGMMGD